MSTLHFTDGWTISYKIIKDKMMADDPHCYWCGILCVDYGKREPGTRDPHDMATVDHLVSRWYRNSGAIVPKVLACSKCNGDRAFVEDAWFRKRYKRLNNI